MSAGLCGNVWLLGLINCEYLVADCLVAGPIEPCKWKGTPDDQVIGSLDD